MSGSFTKTYNVWRVDLPTFAPHITPAFQTVAWTFSFRDNILGDDPARDEFTLVGSGAPFKYMGTAEVGGATGFYAVGADGLTYFLTESTASDLYSQSVTLTPDAPGPGGNDLVITCFFPGTLIATPGGQRPLEDLAIGDPVLTHDGRAAPIRWIGRQTVSTRFADPIRTLPIRVRAGALGEGLPRRDLLVSPAHGLLVDGILVQAGALVNGTSITREQAVPEVFAYVHVELDTHALLLAEGTPAESFVDNASRESFDNWAEHEAPGRGPITEMDLPRAASARQVPPATRRRLDAIARDLGLVAEAAA